jgi:hypothetical protein
MNSNGRVSDRCVAFTVDLGNPVDFIYHLEPWMMVALLPISFSFEGSALIMLYARYFKVFSSKVSSEIAQLQ